MIEKLDLVDAVPVRAEGEVDWTVRLFLVDEGVDEIVVFGKRKTDGPVIYPGTWLERL